MVGETATSLKAAHAEGRKLTSSERFVLIAIAALDLAEANSAHSVHVHAGDSEEDDRDLLRLRKLLMRQLQDMEHTTSAVKHETVVNRCEEEKMNKIAASKHIDLGQYSHTAVFKGDEKKTEKFAKLMGGAKESNSTQLASHATYAPNSEVVSKITRDIENQFHSAVTHKGKKGLGAM
eukprot:GDKJ01018872.1.p1 GENE.GDKJ01018872.1~~GDKJ01018872.1.p1  ORF type:complete len:178 (-),score=23.80 GDKJ01018872.1:36-569(-)